MIHENIDEFYVLKKWAIVAKTSSGRWAKWKIIFLIVKALKKMCPAEFAAKETY